MRRIADLAASLRAFVVRVHRRTADMSRLPFAIALGAAVMMLVAAVEFVPDHDSRVGDVDDLSDTGFEEDRIWEFEERTVSISILESGFGTIIDHQGVERLSVGAVLFNPNNCDAQPVTIAVTAVDGDGRRYTVEQIYVDLVPRESSKPIGHVLLERGVGTADEPELEVFSANCFYPMGDLSDEELEEMGWLYERPEPQIRVIGVEPLLSPAGQRVIFEIEAVGAGNYVVDLRIDVIFRDADGQIVGGMPGWGNPFNQTVTATEYRAVPPGVSIQHLDLPEGRIPEGADLDQLVIGPIG